MRRVRARSLKASRGLGFDAHEACSGRAAWLGTRMRLAEDPIPSPERVGADGPRPDPDPDRTEESPAPSPDESPVARDGTPDKPMDVYLNDHLGGAMLGTDLAKQLRDQNEGTPLGEVMTRIAAEIEEDRETLLELMDALDVSRNPVKQVTGWVAEKASRVKFSGASSGEPDHGTFMALESLRLGVAGKKCLWIALREVRERLPGARNTDLDRLIERASGAGVRARARAARAAATALARG